MSALPRQPGGVEGFSFVAVEARPTLPSRRRRDGAMWLAVLRGAFVTAVDVTKMGPRELAKERSRCDAGLRRFMEAVEPIRPLASGLTGKARGGESSAAGDRICSSRCRATDPESQGERREYNK
jgi:hypothetical protein